MPDFTGKLSADDVIKIQAFIGHGRRHPAEVAQPDLRPYQASARISRTSPSPRMGRGLA
jgi:hypothetical protein